MDKKVKKRLKEFWDFLWHEDTLASWVVSLILIFIIVKFIFFPILSLIMNASMPLVVVESTSMHHPGLLGNSLGIESFKNWWVQNGEWYRDRDITREEAKEWPLNSGLEMGDIVAVTGHGDLEIGDIIIFKANKKHPVIHRIVKISNNSQIYYQTKGDNNPGQLSVEKRISKDQIIGQAIFRIPKAGWVKLGLVKIFSI